MQKKSGAFLEGDLIQIDYTDKHPGYYSKWEGIQHGDLGIILEEHWGYNFKVFFPFHIKSKIKIVKGYLLYKLA